MISQLSQDLFEKLSAIPALSGKVGFTIGGKTADPELSRAPLPCAWAVFQGDKPNDPEAPVVPATQAMRCSFCIFLHVSYLDQADLKLQQDLLDSVVRSVRGSETPHGSRWKFEGRRILAVNPDRLIYAVDLSTIAFI